MNELLNIEQKQTKKTQKTNLQLPKGKGGEGITGVWDQHTHTTIYRTYKQKGPTGIYYIQPGTIVSIL